MLKSMAIRYYTRMTAMVEVTLNGNLGTSLVCNCPESLLSLK